MWTYLAILFSVLLLMGVFIRRVILYMRRGKGELKKKRLNVKKKGGEEISLEKGKQKLSKNDRETVEELCKKAEGKLKAGQEDEAIKYFVQALAVDEFHIETQHKLAMLYMQKQMYAAAAALFKNLGELTGEAMHYSHLGLALYQQNLFEEAKAAYQKAVMLDPGRAQRFVSLAQVYRSLGELQNAAIALNKAIALDEKNIDFLFLLADIQTELGNFDESKEIINKILQLEPENENAKKYLKDLETKSSIGGPDRE